MSVEASGPPPGWYPDPSGTRQWRVWNGREWSPTLRPYGDVAASTSELIGTGDAHGSIVRYGAALYWSGLGLAANVVFLMHRPNSNLTPTQFGLLFALSFVLFFVGHVVFARALSTLVAKPGLEALVPLLNVVLWIRQAALQSSHVTPVRRRTVPTPHAMANEVSAVVILNFVLLGLLSTIQAANYGSTFYLRVIPAMGFILTSRLANAVVSDSASSELSESVRSL